jgi:hypothetical protein
VSEEDDGEEERDETAAEPSPAPPRQKVAIRKDNINIKVYYVLL